MLHSLKRVRISKGLSQEELSEASGVHRDTIHKLETGQRPARPATIKKLADALAVETAVLTTKERKEQTMEQNRTEERVDVEVRWIDKNSPSGMGQEILRFRGEEIDWYDDGRNYLTLYECPGGYRVHVDSGADDEPATLYPEHPDYTITYTPTEVVEEFPMFAEAIEVSRVRGVSRIRDID